MNLRLLSFAALTGMLAATGCGGGTGSGIAPTVGNANTGNAAPSSSTRGLTASFEVPKRYVASSSSTSSTTRKSQYISPGSSGIEVLLTPSTGASGTATWIVGHQGAPVALAGSPGTIFSGNTLSSSSGFIAGSAVTYSYQPSSTSANYYTFTVNVTGLSTGPYTVGVVLTDLAHSNFILSNGQGTVNPYTASNFTPLLINLNPVVANAYIAGPTLAAGQAIGVNNLPANAYEFTVYPADELGYVIPASTAGQTFDSTQAVTVAQFPAVTTGFNVLFGLPAAEFAAAPSYTKGSTNPIPSSAGAFTAPLATAVSAPIAYAAASGAVTIAAPAGGLPNQGPVYSNASPYLAGVPVNVIPAATAGLNVAPTGPVKISAYLVSPVAGGQSGTVYGYTYVPGTNYPTGSATPYAIGTPITVNYTPGIYPVIQ